MRGSGVLLHITSLPSGYGIGDIGYPSYWFADFLKSTKQSYWQILPINPVDAFFDFSPYNNDSAFAGNLILISPELLEEEGLVSKESLRPFLNFSNKKADYERAFASKTRLLEISFAIFLKKKKIREDFEMFCERNSFWLEDYAIFKAIKKLYKGSPWNKWDKNLSEREEKSLKKVKSEYSEEIEKEKFFQFLFFRQWAILKNYCNKNGIKIIGDIPFYVSFDSADVWVNPEIFKLKENKCPAYVGGVPPDYFSDTGQLWGNPVYNWDVLKEKEYYWWFIRLSHASRLFDIIRLDHFRGFVDYWEVPYGKRTAKNGKWVKSPGEDFFRKLFEKLPSLSLIAEDLGFITEEVRKLLKSFSVPGTKVLQFAFGDDSPDNPYLPHNFEKNFVVYTGTHDNNTTKGWFENELDGKGKERVKKYLGKEVSSDNVHWELIRLAMQSVAEISIIPMQDILGLGEEARMNKPSTTGKNWRWRFLKEDVNEEIKCKLLEFTEIYGREG